MSETGVVYVLHFSRPLSHARHYVGWTEKAPEERLVEHLSGRGSPLVRAVVAHGIAVELSTSFPGTRDDERALKNGKNVARRCPRCREAALARAAAGMATSRQRKIDRARRMDAWVAGAKKIS